MSTSVARRLYFAFAPGRHRDRVAVAPVATAAEATLDALATGTVAVVRGLVAPPSAPDWVHHLEALGFVAGEPVRVMARARPGGDPMVVRVGNSTFALRRAEAACVRLEPATT